MEEENKLGLEEQAGTVEPPKKSNREAYLEYVKGRFSDGYDPNDDESMYGHSLDRMRKMDESESKMMEALTSDPRLAQALADIVGKKKGAASALARYFGKDMLNAEEGSEEWDEIEMSEKERMEELQAMGTRKEEYDRNIEESSNILDEFAKKKGIDIDQFLDEVYNRILDPIFSGKYSDEILSMLHNALNYDTDVEEAFQAGSVKGRNEKIEQMKKDVGDGLPKLGNTGITENKTVPKEKPRKPGSVWEQ